MKCGDEMQIPDYLLLFLQLLIMLVAQFVGSNSYGAVSVKDARTEFVWAAQFDATDCP